MPIFSWCDRVRALCIVLLLYSSRVMATPTSWVILLQEVFPGDACASPEFLYCSH